MNFTVVKTHGINRAMLQSLLRDVQKGLQEGLYYHVGSDSLWNHHSDMVTKMLNTLHALELKQVSLYVTLYYKYYIILLIYYDITIILTVTHCCNIMKHHSDMVTRMLNTLHALELKQVRLIYNIYIFLYIF